MSKLDGMPPIYIITLLESGVRRKHCREQFDPYNQLYLNFVTSTKEGDAENLNKTVCTKWAETIQPTLFSHLNAIKLWYNSNSSETALFFEDDVSLDTVPYWNFTWKEFESNLQPDWECVQLCWIRFGDRDSFFGYGDKLRARCWNDFSATAYLINRQYAKKLLDLYYPDDGFDLDVKGADLDIKPEYALWPTTENILFSSIGAIYSFPLFVEEVEKLHSLHQQNAEIKQGEGHVSSREFVMDWWRTIGQSRTISEL